MTLADAFADAFADAHLGERAVDFDLFCDILGEDGRCAECSSDAENPEATHFDRRCVENNGNLMRKTSLAQDPHISNASRALPI